MKSLLAILLFFVAFCVAAQTPFVPGAKYSAGAIVIDANGVQWQCLANTKARTAPTEGPVWTKYIPEVKKDTIFISRVDTVIRFKVDTILVPAQLDPSGITRATMDSVNKRYDSLKDVIKTMEAAISTRVSILETLPTLLKDLIAKFAPVEKLPTTVSGIDTRLKTLEKDPGSMFLKVSMEGYPLIKIVGDTLYVRSLIVGPGKKITETNSTLKID